MKDAAILIVDDDAVVRGVLAGGLRDLGARVTDVPDVPAADRALAAAAFELIISDVHLDGNEGLRWTEKLVLNPAAPPVLLMTGNPEIVTAVRAANLPVAGYLAKPVPFAEIVDMIQTLLAASRQRQALRALVSEVGTLTTDRKELPSDLVRRLDALVIALVAESGRPLRAARDPDAPARQAIRDTITVLEKTRQSFRSQELGRLRRHLEQVLAKNATAWVVLTSVINESPVLISL